MTYYCYCDEMEWMKVKNKRLRTEVERLQAKNKELRELVMSAAAIFEHYGMTHQARAYREALEPRP